MNAASLFLIVVAAIGSVKSADIVVIKATIAAHKPCAADDGACVADVVTEAKGAVKKARKAAKGDEL